MTESVDSAALALVDVPDDLDEFNAFAFREGWSDGLPLVPPTPDRVERMLEGTDFDPNMSLGGVPPRLALATVESIAVNAVMAGCHPTAMPVVLTAVEAMLAPKSTPGEPRRRRIRAR